MAQDPGSAGAKVTKASVQDSDSLFAAVKKRMAERLEKELKEKGKRDKPKQEEFAPETLPTTNVRQLTVAAVVAWVESGGRIPDPDDNKKTLPYTIRAGGESSASAQISLGTEMIGHVTAEIAPRTLDGKMVGDGKLVGGVATINVNQEYRGRGLGLVLAIAFYVRSKAGNAEYVRLASPDTSGGWWANLGMSENAIPIASAMDNVRSFKIRW